MSWIDIPAATEPPKVILMQANVPDSRVWELAIAIVHSSGTEFPDAWDMALDQIETWLIRKADVDLEGFHEAPGHAVEFVPAPHDGADHRRRLWSLEQEHIQHGENHFWSRRLVHTKTQAWTGGSPPSAVDKIL